MKRDNIILGTLILSASTIFVRLIGFVFKVWLASAMGAEGIGVYSLIMSLYMVCATLATSGISGGVSKMAAAEFAGGHVANARRILGRAMTLSLILSFTVGIVLFVFAEPIAVNFLHDSRTVLSLKFLAPGLPLMSASGCLRGYFIARRGVLNPAFSQVLEQLIKMGFIMVMIGYWLPKGIEYGCAIVIFGITIGEVVCFLISFGGYVFEKRRVIKNRHADIKGVTKGLLLFAIPISMGSYVRSISRLIEDVLVISGLQKFMGTEEQATGTYGMLRGMAMPLLVFPLQLLSALVVTLTPEISRMSGTKNNVRLERTISRLLQFTSIIGIFIVCIFISFGYELGVAVYKSAEAGQMLRMLSWICPFMCIEMVVVSILQGLGEQVSSLRYNVADCVLRVLMVFALIPMSGVNGFLFMVVISNLFTSLLNLRRLVKITKISLNFVDWVIKPSIAALAACQIVKLVCNIYLFKTVPVWLSLTVGIIVIALVYVPVLFALGAVKAGDFYWVIEGIRSSGKALKASTEKTLS